MSRQPVIIIGMHRSGTSLLSSMLEKLDLFTGAKKEANGEPIFFVNINRWLIQQAGGRWDHPEPIDYLLEDEKSLSIIEGYIQRLLGSPKAIDFLGAKNYWKYRSLMRIQTPWGWKDPRTTYTLPVWLRLFPGAKILYLERHGVDVAWSLVKREERLRAWELKRYRWYKGLVWLFPKKRGFGRSPRCATLEGAFDLWTDYVARAQRNLCGLDENQYMTIRYEDLLERPEQNLKALASFCGLQYNESRIREICQGVQKSRAYAYRDNPVLKSFASAAAGRLGNYEA